MKKRPASFEHACEMRGYDPATILPDVSKMPEALAKYTTAAVKRLVIVEAINDGKVPQPGQTWRYFPIFKKTGSGFGFLYSDTDYGSTGTDVGARLEFFTQADSDYFGNNFRGLHYDVMVVEQPAEQ